MQWIILGSGGLISSIFAALSTIANLHEFTNIAIMIFGDHTESEWAELVNNNLIGCAISTIITMIIGFIVSLGNKRL